jgi:heme/copper-type cytochrome/quinol oxidase subunit 1
MFTTVRYFVKTSIVFFASGLLTGLYMLLARDVFGTGFGPELISAHTHVMLVGGVMMMIMGVALWFFPRQTKEDLRYNPDRIRLVYWIMTVATAARFMAQAALSFGAPSAFRWIAVTGAVGQFASIGLFFYSIWGRIRPLGSALREAAGEKF